MATKSILKNIIISGDKSTDNFASAVEKLQCMERDEVKMKGKVRELTGKEIREMFGK